MGKVLNSLFKEDFFNPELCVSVSEIREKVNKSFPILGKRTLNYWAREGLLKKPFRIPGRKDAFYHKDYIYDAIFCIILAKGKFGRKLNNIAKIAKQINHEWEPVLIEMLERNTLRF